MKQSIVGVATLATIVLSACGDDVAGTDGDTDSAGFGTSIDPTTSTSATSTSTTTGMGTGTGAGTSTGGSSSSTSSDNDPPVCNPADDLEPNNTENTAMQLDNITDEDGAGDFFDSILAGDQDVDWFWYKGTDVAFAYVDPTATLDTEMTLRLCLFVNCHVGETPAVDCNNSIDALSPENGLPGCCQSGKEPYVMIDLTCDGGGDDSADVYMRVDQGYPEKCVHYTLDYHF